MKKSYSVFLFIALLTGCQKKETTVIDKTARSFERERSIFIENLQKPAEVSAQLQKIPVAFNPLLINNPKAFVNYTGDNTQAAVNLGIYLSDLNYCVAYRQAAYTKELFEAAIELSKTTAIEKTALDFLMKRYEENLHTNDSVKSVLEELFRQSTEVNDSNNRDIYVGLAMAGYQIENLHLALGIIDAYPKKLLETDSAKQVLTPTFRMVLSQQPALENILTFLNAISDPTDPDRNPNYAYYANAFLELIDVYKKLNVEEKLSAGEWNTLLNDNTITELQQKVNTIRKKAIQ